MVGSLWKWELPFKIRQTVIFEGRIDRCVNHVNKECGNEHLIAFGFREKRDIRNSFPTSAFRGEDLLLGKINLQRYQTGPSQMFDLGTFSGC